MNEPTDTLAELVTRLVDLISVQLQVTASLIEQHKTLTLMLLEHVADANNTSNGTDEDEGTVYDLSGKRIQ